jgi:hypothetical protein
LVRGGDSRIGWQLPQPAKGVVDLDVVESHNDGLQVAGEFLPVLKDAEGIEDDMHEGLQIRHSLEFREGLELGAAEVLVTRTRLRSSTFSERPTLILRGDFNA